MQGSFKYEADVQKHILDKLEKDKPSSEASYWAKSNCKYCYGRGVEGKVTVKMKDGNTFVNEPMCICAKKKWLKWRENKIAGYKIAGYKIEALNIK